MRTCNSANNHAQRCPMGDIFFLLNPGFCLPEPASRSCVARTCSRGEGVTKFQNISLVSFVLNRLTEGGFI